MGKILILGGYGNFGSIISTALAASGHNIIIAGRNIQNANSLAAKLSANAEAAQIDISTNLVAALQKYSPSVVINTCGPFQKADYSIAQACIENNIHYIDLADARDFVCNITLLDEAAKKNNVSVISGASTVPALSSAVLEKYKDEFSSIELFKYGISPGQKTTRGIATVKAVMSYVGKSIRPPKGSGRKIYGWQNTYLQKMPGLRSRLMSNCEIPDLDLLPARYNIKEIKFSAGMESKLLHVLIMAISWLIRLGVPIKLENHAEFLLKASYRFNIFGTEDGGMHAIMKGIGKDGMPHTRKWFIIAKSGHGPNIPCIPAIILARKLANGGVNYKSALPCVGLITLDEYMAELKNFDISLHTASN